MVKEVSGLSMQCDRAITIVGNFTYREITKENWDPQRGKTCTVPGMWTINIWYHQIPEVTRISGTNSGTAGAGPHLWSAET